MVEATKQQQNANKTEVFFWMITDDNYEYLRTITGCEKLTDLNATQTDSEHVLRLARSLGVPEKNMFINNRSTLKDLKNTYQ